jgi:3-deoxy-D-manno-octulosonic-acid transferase
MIFSALLLVYSASLIAVLVVGLPYWLVRMATAAKYREGLMQRLGRVPKVLLKKPLRPIWEAGSAETFETIWVHAVSVGEVAAVTELVTQLAMRGYRVVVSTTTRTGQRMARERFGEKSVFYFPLDLARIVRRYLRVLEPKMLVLVESEFWPNLLAECRRSGVVVAVVNARISDRSYPQYRRLRRVWRPILSGISLVLAQSELDVERLKAIGAPADRVRLGGNLKFDVRPPGTTAVTAALRENLPEGMQLLVCGSTLAGEEAMMLEAWASLGMSRKRPGACMVIAPRHPERFGAVAKLLEQSGVVWERKTEWIRSPERLRPGSVFLLNSIGELASVYSLASVAFVGGSLVAAGGHNPLEPAQFGVPVVMGPYYHNFRTIVKRLLKDDAVRIVTAAAGPGALDATLGELLVDAAMAEALGARGLAVFRSESGATARAVEALVSLARGGVVSGLDAGVVPDQAGSIEGRVRI